MGKKIETCEICWEEQQFTPIYSEKRKKQSNAIRYLENGKLGVLLTTTRITPKHIELAKAMASIGADVGDDFFSARVHPHMMSKLEDSSYGIQSLRNDLQNRCGEANFILKSYKRNLGLYYDGELLHHSELVFYEYLVQLPRKKGSAPAVIRKNSFQKVLKFDELMNVNQLQWNTEQKSSIESKNYEAVFSSTAFDVILDLLLHCCNARICTVTDFSERHPFAGSVLSESITIDSSPKYSNLFDDEGVQTNNKPLFDRGVFTGYFNDLYTANKLGVEPTGNGFRGMFLHAPLQEGIPSSKYPFARMQSGKVEAEDMIASMSTGILVEELSLTYNHDFFFHPVQLPLKKAWYVENGNVIGRIDESASIVIDLRSFFKFDLTVSKKAEQVWGKEIPWIHAPQIMVLAK
ncbi:metallopeptidase TldD-related protein [Tumebacillus flagellatus]|uniref:Metalloprotease TldD/E C-terminal domain-containing protein n=1 Tax=Tumebacillus flagellatus TaxID=1157490 RepID=A0A074MDP3_9BACL|nr:metallopeptidase TldD-related protein [Tumebacillus flagellatus]KEO83962.1 hypothetical protein EL26_07180 [Tumebacillus flagellatus]